MRREGKERTREHKRKEQPFGLAFGVCLLGPGLFLGTCENTLQISMTRNHFFCFFSFLVLAFFFMFSGCLQFAGIFTGLYCSSALRKNHLQINMIRNHFSLQSGARAPKPAQSIKKGAAAISSASAQC